MRFNGTTKSVDAFLSQLGFTALPKPTIEQIARAVHLKFACAGTDTLYYTAAILGFHIPREVCRAVATSCHLCPHKTLHGPLESIRSEDIIAPDVTEYTLNEAERNILKKKMGVSVGVPAVVNDGVVTSTLPKQVFAQGVPAPVKRDFPIENGQEVTSEANELDHLLFGAKFAHEEDGVRLMGALEATENQEVLVFDYCHWGNNNVLVMKFEARGLYFLEKTERRTAEPVINLIKRVRTTLKSVVCDNAPEFLRVKSVCDELGVQFNPTHLGRPEVKGRQESAVKAAKLMLRWCVEAASRQMAELEFQGHHLVKTAQFMLNIRASPRRKLIPWHVAFRVRPRLDLQVFSPVRFIRTSKILVDESKADVVLYLGQSDPQTGLYCHPGSLKILRGHISKFRAPKVSVENYINMYDETLELGALSLTTRKLGSFDRKSDEWKEAIHEHAQK